MIIPTPHITNISDVKWPTETAGAIVDTAGILLAKQTALCNTKPK